MPMRLPSCRVPLTADPGCYYRRNDSQAELRYLGITSSPAFVRAPEDNGAVERFIQTLKEQLLWIRTFQKEEELRQTLLTSSIPIMNSGSSSSMRPTRQSRYVETGHSRRRPHDEDDRGRLEVLVSEPARNDPQLGANTAITVSKKF